MTRIVLTAIEAPDNLLPFLALADELHRRRADVIFAVPAYLGGMAEEAGFPVIQLGPDTLAKQFEEAEPSFQAGKRDAAVESYSRALFDAAPSAINALSKLAAESDVLVSSILQPLGSIVAARSGIPFVAVQHHSPALQISPPPEIVDMRAQLGLQRDSEARPDGISPMSGYSSRLTLVATSPMFLNAMIGHAPRWPENCMATGFWLANEPADYKPTAELAAILSADRPIVFSLGYGFWRRRREIVDVYADAARATGRVAVWHDIWSGPSARSTESGIITVGSDVPTQWLFQRAACVVHDSDGHQTSAAALAGAPTIAIPYDESLLAWGKAGQQFGVTAAVMDYRDLGADRLADALTHTCDEPSYRKCALALRRRLAQEGGASAAADLIIAQARER
jgi:UDP:flavonoid glycosyltransferase YjiC (YdhE family)